MLRRRRHRRPLPPAAPPAPCGCARTAMHATHFAATRRRVDPEPRFDHVWYRSAKVVAPEAVGWGAIDARWARVASGQDGGPDRQTCVDKLTCDVRFVPHTSLVLLPAFQVRFNRSQTNRIFEVRNTVSEMQDSAHTVLFPATAHCVRNQASRMMKKYKGCPSCFHLPKAATSSI